MNINFRASHFIDWAFEMIDFHCDSENLLMLASFDRSATYSDMLPYAENAIAELGLKFINKRDGRIIYAEYLIFNISEYEDIRGNLMQLCSIDIYGEHEDSLSVFYFLNWAWGDIDFGNDYQDYFPEATKVNIESIVIDKAKTWLKKNGNTLPNKSRKR